MCLEKHLVTFSSEGLERPHGGQFKERCHFSSTKLAKTKKNKKNLIWSGKKKRKHFHVLQVLIFMEERSEACLTLFLLYLGTRQNNFFDLNFSL